MEHPTIKEIKDYLQQLNSIQSPLSVNPISKHLKNLMTLLEFFGSDNDNLEFYFEAHDSSTDEYGNDFYINDGEYYIPTHEYQITIENYLHFYVKFSGNYILLFSNIHNEVQKNTFIDKFHNPQFKQKTFEVFIYQLFELKIEYLKDKDYMYIPMKYIESLESVLPQIKGLIRANQITLALELYKGLNTEVTKYINSQLPF